jgi:hypothetical protein
VNSPEIFVDLCPYADRVDLRLRTDRLTINGDVVQRGKWMKEPVLVEVEEGTTPPIAISLPMVDAQALMDRLWKAGLRPTEGSGSAGALSATKYHLEDVRTLLFDCHEPPTTHCTTDNDMYRKLVGEG